MSSPDKANDRLGQDWQARHERLKRVAAALTKEQEKSQERDRAILEERARLLARVPRQAARAEDVLEVLIFAWGNERCAVEAESVSEVLCLGDVTPLPGTPDFLLGVTNLRGQILAVFDLRKLFGMPGPEPTADSRLIVMGIDQAEFAILVDAVFEMGRVRTDEVLETPGSIDGLAREFLRGVTAQPLMVLDGAVLLKDPRLTIDNADDNRTALLGRVS